MPDSGSNGCLLEYSLLLSSSPFLVPHDVNYSACFAFGSIGLNYEWDFKVEMKVWLLMNQGGC